MSRQVPLLPHKPRYPEKLGYPAFIRVTVGLAETFVALALGGLDDERD